MVRYRTDINPSFDTVFHNDVLLGLVFEYVNPRELLSVLLTCRVFHSACQRLALIHPLTISAKSFCHSGEGVK